MTYTELMSPTNFVHDENSRRDQAISLLVFSDCIVSDASLKCSMIFIVVHINSYASLENVVMLPACDVGRNHLA